LSYIIAVLFWIVTAGILLSLALSIVQILNGVSTQETIFVRGFAALCEAISNIKIDHCLLIEKVVKVFAVLCIVILVWGALKALLFAFLC
jgi:hypothetical protein